jgi:chitodextrinase
MGSKGPLRVSADSAERAAPNDVWWSDGQQPTQNQTVPVHECVFTTEVRTF